MKVVKGIVFFVVLGGYLYFNFLYDEYGTLIEFNGTELYYTENVTEDVATRLGDYLVAEEFADGTEKTVQLDKPEETYQFRMVAKEGIANNDEWKPIFLAFTRELKEAVFPNDNIELHLCDDSLETLQVVEYSSM